MNPALFKIGLFAIGLDAYWQQFKGLEERLGIYLKEVEKVIAAIHPQVVNAGMVDTVDKAFTAGQLFRQQDVDIIFLYVATYALSATVLPVVQRAKVPVVILNLSPAGAIDYVAFNAMGNRKDMTAEWLAHCSACPVPEIANLFKRTGIPFFEVTGMLYNDVQSHDEIREWVEAARVKNIMYYNRMGCLGHYYSGMLDIYTDLTLQLKYFGGHFELLEADELFALRNTVTEAETTDRVQQCHELFEVLPGCPDDELKRCAQTSVALDKLVKKYALGSMAYYYKGTGIPQNEDIMTSVILGKSMLTARGIPCAGEYEIKNAQAMKILDAFKAGGSFTEYYAMDYTDDVVLMGHDGPGHITMAEGKTKVRALPVYHGKQGRGLSVEMTVKHGPVTLLSVVEDGHGKLFLLTAEGESVSGPVLQIGNTNSRYKFYMGARQFVHAWNGHGPAHHCAVGIGHITGKIKKLGALLGMEVIVVC